MANEVALQVHSNAITADALRSEIASAELSASAGLAVSAGGELAAIIAAAKLCNVCVAAVVLLEPLIDPTRPDLFDAGYPIWCETLTATKSHAIPLMVGPIAHARPDAPLRPDDLIRDAVDSLRKIRFDAERCGVRIALQFPNDLGLSADDVRELIDEANSYWISVELDASASPSSQRAADASEFLAHRIAAVRVRSSDPREVALAQQMIQATRADALLIIDPAPSSSPTR